MKVSKYLGFDPPKHVGNNIWANFSSLVTNLDNLQIEDFPRKPKQQNQNTPGMAIDFT